MLTRVFAKGLQGDGAHVDSDRALQGLQWQLAGERPGGSPHSIWQVLGHMLYWQDYILAELRGEQPECVNCAEESWPHAQAPGSESEWQEAVRRFLAGLSRAAEEAQRDLEAPLAPGTQAVRAEALAVLINHNSYHLGQIVLLRRMLGAWPPPEGANSR